MKFCEWLHFIEKITCIIWKLSWKCVLPHISVLAQQTYRIACMLLNVLVSTARTFFPRKIIGCVGIPFTYEVAIPWVMRGVAVSGLQLQVHMNKHIDHCIRISALVKAQRIYGVHNVGQSKHHWTWSIWSWRRWGSRFFSICCCSKIGYLKLNVWCRFIWNSAFS